MPEPTLAMRVEIVGLNELIARFASIPERAVQSIARALFWEANEVFNQSQNLVPVRLGILKGSGQVSAPEVGASTVEVVVGYGGDAKEYAVVVHEDLEAYHAPPTQAKFLEEPALAAQEGMGERIAARVARDLIGGA